MWQLTTGDLIRLVMSILGTLGLGYGLKTGGIKRWVAGWVETIVGLVVANYRLKECQAINLTLTESLRLVRQELVESRRDFGDGLHAGSTVASPIAPESSPPTALAPRSRRRIARSTRTARSAKSPDS